MVYSLTRGPLGGGGIMVYSLTRGPGVSHILLVKLCRTLPSQTIVTSQDTCATVTRLHLLHIS